MKAACGEGQECQNGRCLTSAIMCTGDAVFYDFNRHNVKCNQRDKLDTIAQCLSDAGDAAATVQLQGYADERGTSEYNLALGERRAESARRYLENKGAKAGKLSTISYGEENPADSGHNERAWRQNRRVEFAPR
jgi:peptidoglycan-associated lipoprotein